MSPVCQYKYEFFISYPAMATPNQPRLVDQFTEVLKNKLDFLQEITAIQMAFRAPEDLQPGLLWEQMIPRALCQSRCMLLVYTDEYFRREYCVKELQAMRRLEQMRGFRSDTGESLIIPLIVQARDGARGRPAVPDEINKLNFLDFRPMRDPKPQFRTNAVRNNIDELLRRLQKIQSATAEPGIDCSGFEFNERVEIGSAPMPPNPSSWAPVAAGR